MIDRDPEPSRTLLSMQALRWRALAEIRQQPGYSGVLDIGINHVTDGPMMERRPIGGASHGHGLLRGSRTVDLNQSSTLRVCGYSLRVGESLMQFAERFKCQKCGAWYAVMWEQSPLREPAPGTFNCPDCGTVVHSWSGIDHYTDWRLLRRPLTAPIAPAGAITGSRSRSRRGRR